MRFYLMIIISILAIATQASADFDARYWQKYAEIILPTERALPPFGAVNLNMPAYGTDGPAQDLNSIRVITQSKREEPYQIITRRPQTRQKAIEAQMVNLSQTIGKDTVFEGVVAENRGTYNAIEIVTGERKFFRQVQISGSADGVSWYRIRSDSVIFDYSEDGRQRHTIITIPDTRYKYLKVLVKNRNERPLRISGLKVFNDVSDKGHIERTDAAITKQETDAQSHTTTIEFDLKQPAILHGIDIRTGDRNFYRVGDIFIKDEKGEWTHMGTDYIFNSEGENLMESKSSVMFPEVRTGRVKLVIRNMDSPALKITGATALSYQKTLVFKIESREKYYIFWGNPNAKPPVYDIASHVAAQDTGKLRTFGLGEFGNNPDFVGSDKALPFTERYKYLIYVFVALVIAGLAYYQYRIIKKTGDETRGQ